MEAGFGHDFSRVRIFAGDRGDAAAARVGARAVTIDRDIFFARGEYRAGEPRARELLAHELAHVVQRDQGGAPLAYRDARDVRRVARALRSAASTLTRSVRYMPTPDMESLVRSIAEVVSGFFPTGHGRIDEHGVETAASQTVNVDQPIRRGGITGTYRHELRIYLSEEHVSEEARYQPTPNGGEIRVFVANVVSMSEPDLISTVAHEIVHLFTHIIARATQFAHRLRATQSPLPGSSGAGGRPISLSISRADPTLGGSSTFAAQVDALRRVYQPVVDFVNQARVARGATALDPVAVAASWAGRTGDELLAYVIDEQVNIGVQFATQRAGAGGGLMAMVPPFDPVRFFVVYASQHWLEDPADRAALRAPGAQAVLGAVGRSAEMRAVYRTIEQWVQATRTP